MHDPYLELVILLQDKEQAVLPVHLNSIKDSIKIVATQLRDDPRDDYHLDAAFAYYIAGYYVHASRLVLQMEVGGQIHPAQRWLALFLLKHFATIQDQVQSIATDDRYSDSRIQKEVTACGLADLEVLDRILVRKIADVLSVFLEFVSCGDEAKLGTICSILAMCQRVACRANEWQWWWWAECIRLVINEFAANCLWTQLKSMRQELNADQIVSKYITANYERNDPVVELWRTQVESLDKVNDPERRSFCLAVPTSGGKTRVAELAILRFLMDYRDDLKSKCVYIAPLRKLANEIEQTFSAAFSAATSNSRVVSSFYGGWEVDPLDQYELDSARVLIVTPEKLDGMLRHNRDLLPQIRLVIADEGHMIGDDSPRGYRYRMLLERLVYSLRLKRALTETRGSRLLFISGVLPNVAEFAELITGDRSNTVCVDWRPLDEPLKGKWEWDGIQLTGSNEILPSPVPFPLFGCSSPKKFEEIVARTAFTCAMYSHTMVFSASKRVIESDTLLELLECLSDQQPLTNDPLPSGFVRRSSFEKYYSLLERGVAIHHSDLPIDLKSETEARIYDGRVRLLFASPTLAQGVNIPFDTVLVYRLQHHMGNAIQPATFWNVVGRVGRPIAASTHSSSSMHPPRVVFLVNKSPEATKEDKHDRYIGESLIKREKQYRVASPFLQFLNNVRKEWMQDTGRPIAELVEGLAERPDLQWITDLKARKELTTLLRLLDEQMIALIEESGTDENADDWLQARSAEVVDLLIGATSIEPEDLDFIREAVLARATFVARNMPKRLRRQDYALGLPLEDCEAIRANQDSLLSWYQGCTDIFARRLDSGIDTLVHLLNFVSTLSICPRKWRSQQPEPLPLFGLTVPDVDTVRRSALFKSWILGEDAQAVASKLRQLVPDADLDEYREEMFERNLAWGLSALCNFLSDFAQDNNLHLTKDLEFLPSLVKYGVPGKLACYLVRLKIPREDAVRITDLHIGQTDSDDDFAAGLAQSAFAYAETAIQSLTEGNVASLHLSEAAVERIKEIRTRNPTRKQELQTIS